ncbi:transglycosylase [Caulobacter sp. CCUG 60055]|uniref:murein transglycosylase A n=1 Tax=Caulobacter sp. CCUG 60055 TaxID=2100090 RepID=UPI001FA71130|nr:MltA domain-containing protein [Caulobacter sp. CCUG 60055]MBQ1543274.1 MltA domain-containing protein [Caulobacteraceae bacterium]MCI3179828.1 transglycosylase [Caulobacter sp. CCUG 60055]
MRFGGFAGVVASSLLLYACATAPKPAPPVPPRPPVEPSQGGVATPPPPATAQLRFSDLPGWAQDDHAAALRAFQDGCGVAKPAALADACRRARALGPVDEAAARAYLEAHFRPEAVVPPPGDKGGLLTGYFAPVYEARFSRQGPFTAAVRGRPADLAANPDDPGVIGRQTRDGFEPYPDRAAIEAVPAREPLAWMRPEDLFFLQIQGSGVLVLPDGRRFKALFSANNGRPFVGIATYMRDQGLLRDDNTSADNIRNWLADHRGPEADAVMRRNPRYVFFHVAPDDGKEPNGAAGVALTPGRSIAVDPTRHPFGGLYWIDASAPALAGAFPVYRRLAVALDVGGAIKGEVRADLYTGRGDAAGGEAGRVRHILHLYRLVPVDAVATSPAPVPGRGS